MAPSPDAKTFFKTEGGRGQPESSDLRELVDKANKSDLQQEQQRLVICNNQHNQANRKHASKEPRQQRKRAKPLRPPRIITHVLWGYPLTPQNTARD